jgi:hypothetical protein
MTLALSRRSFLGCACCAPLAASLTLGPGALAPAHAAGKKTDLTADQALQLLKEGNRKWLLSASGVVRWGWGAGLTGVWPRSESRSS